MVHILYTTISATFQEYFFATHLKTFPKDMQVKIKRYHKWQDQQAAVLGKLLLRKGLEKIDSIEDPLAILEYSAYGRPSIPKNIDFNISHSGDYVICALSTQFTLGIDIEKIKSINPIDFKTQMTPEEWNTIATAPNQTRAFYHYWTQKEAVIKADGKGLSIPLDSFMIINEITTIASNTWHTLALPIHPEYQCYLATPQKITPQEVYYTPIFFDERMTHTPSN